MSLPGKRKKKKKKEEKDTFVNSGPSASVGRPCLVIAVFPRMLLSGYLQQLFLSFPAADCPSAPLTSDRLAS